MSQRHNLIALVLLSSIVLGCESATEPASRLEAPRLAKADTPAPAKASEKDASTAGSWAPELAAKIKVDDGGGKEVFTIKPEPDGAKLVDAAGHEIARYNLKGDKFKIKDRTDRVLGYVTGSGGKYHLKDPEQKTILFEFQRQPDGDWKLKDGHETLLSKIKKREYGFEIEDAHDKSLGKIKTKDGKVSLRDASDKVRYTTHSSAASPLLLTCLGLDQVGDPSMRAALLVRLALDLPANPVRKGDSTR
jgi:hypothetical protein